MPKRKTDAEFKKEVFDLVGNEYIFLDSYVNTMTKLRVKHTKCGNTYEVIPNNFFKGQRCPYCAGNAKKTDAQFKREVKNLVGNEYTFLDSYVNSKTKIKVRHNLCKNTYYVKPSQFLSGRRCPHCAKEARKKAKIKTNEGFKKEVYDLVGNEYTFLDAYQGASIKLNVKHNKCNSVYRVTPAHFLSGCRCPYCASIARKKTDTQFKQEVKNLVGGEYVFLDKYVNSNTKIRVKHNKCGHIYKVKPNAFLNASHCPYCSETARKTDEQFKQEVFNLVGNEYTFLEPYVNADTKIRVKHNKCGNVYEVRPYSFLEGYGCPYCNTSKGEILITKILDMFNIKYEYQKTFDDLRDINLLSYDFYIPDQNILIEYQGRQHYEPVDIFGGKKQFSIQQKHDQMKSDYAKKHGYNLIAVPYTEDTFSKIKKYLIKHELR